MTSHDCFVIVGAGLAGAKAAEALRQKGFDGRIVLIGDEHEPPYERPPLSKDYLLGTADRDSTFVHPLRWYPEHDIDLRIGIEVTGIDPTGHRVRLADGRFIDYTKLLLTTGSSPRRPPVTGVHLGGVRYLRSLADSDALKASFRTASRLVIIGGGWIGLETAAAARASGISVTILEMAELPLLRVLGVEAAQLFADLHRRNGVDLRCGVNIAEITGNDGHVNGVTLTDGSRVAADTVLIGAGITPNIRLAQDAGVTIENGIRVDEHLCTSERDIYAAGDVANAFHPLLGKHIRVEHWANALHQGPAAAGAMLGQGTVFDRLPYFFSDQYDLSMEYTGYVEPGGHDRVVLRGDVDSGQYVVFWLRGGRVLAGMNVNIWDVTDAIAQLILAGCIVGIDRLADPHTPLESLVSSAQHR
jgi:3-phenylpropionate/trans-cinnamate dioxygenase ferredoxin reductase subunit